MVTGSTIRALKYLKTHSPNPNAKVWIGEIKKPDMGYYATDVFEAFYIDALDELDLDIYDVFSDDDERELNELIYKWLDKKTRDLWRITNVKEYKLFED